MNLNKLLLWEKWRPKNIDDIIILPRIREKFQDGISQHYIFYGHYGCGKTSLARILIGKYSKKSAFLELNCSMDTSIDVLRTEIDTFCKVTPLIETDSDIKYVFLDEFDRVSAQFQDAFKAFIEKYNNKVRFIIVTNHINKISDGIKSRIKSINFDTLDSQEEKFLKIEIYKRIFNVILPQENKSIQKEQLINIINKKFPDFRSILVDIQDFFDSGNVISTGISVSNAVKLDLYNLLFDKSQDYEKVYHFILKNFGPENIGLLFNLLGRPFIDYCLENKTSIENLFECNYVISDYSSKLESSIDPIVLGMTVVGKFQELLNS